MPTFQTDMFSGQALRDAGISLASDNAEKKEPGWNERAFELFKDFIKGRTDDFMCEDFREFCEAKDFTAPPSKRAFGHTILKAARLGLIIKVGYSTVKNPIAHMANASRWKPILMEKLKSGGGEAWDKKEQREII